MNKPYKIQRNPEIFSRIKYQGKVYEDGTGLVHI